MATRSSIRAVERRIRRDSRRIRPAIPRAPTQAVWSIAFSGGEPRKIDDGHSAKISSQGLVAYIRDGEIYLASLSSGAGKARNSLFAGKITRWNGRRTGRDLLLFRRAVITVSLRFTTWRRNRSAICRQASIPIRIQRGRPMASASRSFGALRSRATRREGYFIEPDQPHPWAIWVADMISNSPAITAHEIWHSSMQPNGSLPYMADSTGGGVLNWAADDRLVIASEEDGWQHLYTLSAEGGEAQLLTPGECEVEQWSFSPDRKTVFFNSNCGDIDRRHLWTVNVAGGAVAQQSGGNEIEWSPVALSDGKELVYHRLQRRESVDRDPHRFVHPLSQKRSSRFG